MTLNFRNASVPYVRATNKRQKEPVYYVRFGSVTGPLGTTIPNLPDEYSSGFIQNATKNRKKLLLIPSARSNQIDAITCHTTFSSMQFTLLDKNGEITNLVNNYTMKNRLVTIQAGYQDIDESDFIGFTGQIDDWQQTPDGTGYTFMVVGALKNLLGNILTGHTTLSTQYNVGDQIAFVTQLSNFARKTDLHDGQGARNYIRIDRAIYSYEGLGNEIQDGTVLWTPTNSNAVLLPAWKQSTAYTVGQQVVNLGNTYTCAVAGTSAGSGNGPNGQGTPMFFGLQFVNPLATGDLTDSNHSIGSNVDNYVLFQGNPITLMLQIMFSTGYGTNYSGTGVNYDVFPTAQGVGVPFNLINKSHIEAQRDTFLPGVVVQQFFTDSIQCVKFFEAEFTQQLCLWLFENRAGQADIAFFYVPRGTLDAVTIDDSLIIGQPQFAANLPTGAQFLNEVSVVYDFQPGQGSQDAYLNQLVIFDSDSQVKYREASTLNVKAKIFKTFFGAARLALRTATIFITLYKTPPPKITCKLFYSTHLLNVGDVVYFTSKFTPDPKKPAVAAEFCVCINLTPDFRGGNVQATFLGFGFNETGRHAGIAPDGIPNYTLASADQKKAYAFICGADGKMSNDDPGYLITP